MVFDKLNISDLISAADIGHRYRHLVIRHYAIPKFKMHESVIRFVGNMLAKDDILISNNSVEILSFSTAQKVLRIFGNLISNLKLNHGRYNPTQARTITKYINDYCSESLAEIEFKNFKDTLMEQLHKPFVKVQNIQLIAGILPNEPFDLNIAFTAMHRLEFKWVTVTESKYLERHYPHLEHLQMNGHKTIVGIIAFNPQIESLSVLGDYDFDFLRFISSNARKLSALALNGLPTDFTETTFRRIFTISTVKKFTLNLSKFLDHSPEYSPFDLQQVEEFKLSITHPFPRWVDLIVQYQNIRKFKVEPGILDNDQWNKILTGLPNLKEVFLKWDGTKSTEVIAALINNSTVLEKVTFLNTGANFRDTIRNQINDQWILFYRNRRNFGDTIFVRSVEEIAISSEI